MVLLGGESYQLSSGSLPSLGEEEARDQCWVVGTPQTRNKHRDLRQLVESRIILSYYRQLLTEYF